MSLSNSFDQIKLPTNQRSVRLFRKSSFIGGMSVLIGACIIFFGSVLQSQFFASIFGRNVLNMPTVIALAACGIDICLYDRNKIFQRFDIDQQTVFLFLSVLILFIGLSTGIAHTFPLSMFQYLSVVDVRAGFVFSLIGLSMLITYSLLPHRFHYSQVLLLIALSISLFDFLQNMYQFVTVDKFIFNGRHTIFGSMLFFITVTSLIFARPDRGFIGLFTMDTQSSKLARRSLLYFALLPPVLGFYILAGESIGISDAFGRLAFLVVAIILMAMIITWVNIKLLYSSEVERFVMRETLRENNISLESHAKDLSEQLKQVEKAKKSIADKLNHQETLADLIDSYA